MEHLDVQNSDYVVTKAVINTGRGHHVVKRDPSCSFQSPAPDAMDLMQLLSNVLTPDSLSDLWCSLSTDGKSALRASCRGIRDIIDLWLVDGVTIEIATYPRLQLLGVARYLQRLHGKRVALRLRVSKSLQKTPQMANELMCQLLSCDRQCLRIVDRLQVSCPGSVFAGLPVEDAVTELIATNLPSLTSLELTRCNLASTALQALSSCQHLLELSLEKIHLTDAGFGAGAQWPPQLTMLYFDNYSASQPGWNLQLASLTSLSHLQSLSVYETNWTSCFDCGQLTRLSDLQLWDENHQLTHLDASFLSQLPALKALRLAAQGPSFSTVLPSLPQMTQLIFLSLCSDEALPVFSSPPPSMSALQQLEITAPLPLQALHWWLTAAPNVFDFGLDITNPILIPNPEHVLGGKAAVARLLCEVTQQLVALPAADLEPTLDFYTSGAMSIMDCISALSVLGQDLHTCCFKRAVTGPAALTAVAAALPAVTNLRLEQCELVEVVQGLAALARHPTMRTGWLQLEDCTGTRATATAVFALAAMAPGMRITISDDSGEWWTAEYDAVMLGMQAELMRQATIVWD